jgi:7-cyano-7-deazaguanine reductase
MNTINNHSDLNHAPLGKKSAYEDTYNPSLLFPIPRLHKRKEIGIDTEQGLPFFGVDVWNAFELSWLNRKGKPEVALARFDIPADSPNLIESKSFKLYLNSFNQTVIDHHDDLIHQITLDLSQACGKSIKMTLIPPSQFHLERVEELSGVNLDELDVSCYDYHPDPKLLSLTKEQHHIKETLCSNLLKSNCLVTGQPDWGSIFISYSGVAWEHASILRYLVSFRQHQEFHEQCIERIFVDIMKMLQPEHLTVYARYTRRGGLDINPYRSTNSQLPSLINRTARQ